MSASPTVHLDISDTNVHSLVYENGGREQLALTAVGLHLYRLDETSFLGDARYGDMIRVKERSDGALLFVEIAERSTLVSQSWIMSADRLKNERTEVILRKVIQVGGMWEQAFGGLLIVHLPPEVAERLFQQISELGA